MQGVVLGSSNQSPYRIDPVGVDLDDQALDGVAIGPGRAVHCQAAQPSVDLGSGQSGVQSREYVDRARLGRQSEGSKKCFDGGPEFGATVAAERVMMSVDQTAGAVGGKFLAGQYESVARNLPQ